MMCAVFFPVFDVEKRLRSVCRWFSDSPLPILFFFCLIEIHASRVSSSRWYLLSFLYKIFFIHYVLEGSKSKQEREEEKTTTLNSQLIHSSRMAVAISYIFCFSPLYTLFDLISRCEYVCVSLLDFYQCPPYFSPFLCCSKSCVCAVLPPLLTPLSLSLSIRFRCNCRPLSI
jgi:hypothetical protein